MKLRVGHSPDPDDAFMVWAFHAGAVETDGFDVELVPRDIASLNERALDIAGDALEVTALSAATYACVSDRYWLLRHGASFGDGYGPIVVARSADVNPSEVVIATPGESTTAVAALRMAIPGVRCRHMPFDAILPAVQRGEVDAGLLIHEGQLTYTREGVHKLLDLGVWWKDETGLPLPLGVNTLSKSLGPEAGARANRILRDAIETGLARRKEALEYARGFGRGIPEEEADRFVAMYVNDLTRDMGPRGVAAIETFLARASAAGLVPASSKIAFP